MVSTRSVVSTSSTVRSSSTAGLLPLETAKTFGAKRHLSRQLQKQIHLCSYRAGFSSIYARLNKRRTGHSVASILMYHSIPSAHEVPWMDPRNCLLAKTFEQHMQFLQARRHVVSMDELTRQLKAKEPIRPGTVAITFDDGYLNNLRVAAPILAKYNLPATLYLATAYISQGENQWIDTLYAAFRARSKHQLVIGNEKWDLRSQDNAAYRAIVQRLISCLPEQRQALLNTVNEQLAPTAYPPRMTMTWDDVRKLHQDHPQITLGVHTANHIDLDTHSDRTHEEMRLAIEQVKSEVGVRPQHLAFPYNRYNSSAQAQVAQHVKSAVATAPDPVVRTETSLYALPRLEGPKSLTLLKSWTNGGFPGVTQRLLKQPWTSAV
ncbi:MAG: polysaccharide deacetylase family protein [Cyanobacteria bacterium J06621_11]